MSVTSRTHRVGPRLARGAAVALVAASGLLLSACGDPDGGSTPTPGTSTPTLPPETPGAPLPPGTPVPGEPGQPDEPGAGEPEPSVTSTERLDPDDQQTIPPQR